MNSFGEHPGIPPVSSRVWGSESDLYSSVLLHDSKTSFEGVLNASSRATFNSGTAVASHSVDKHSSSSLSDPFEDLPAQLASISISQDSVDEVHGVRIKSILPPWAMSNDGEVKLSLMDLVHKGMLEQFAKDRLGSQYLRSAYPMASCEERAFIAKEVLNNDTLFNALACDVFANFFIQQIIELGTDEELRMVCAQLGLHMHMYCLNRYSCRVVQKAFDFLSAEPKLALIHKFHHTNLVRLSVDQNANHVIQKIISSFPLYAWVFILDNFLFYERNFFDTVEDKYGCRIVQLCVELLAAMERSGHRDHYIDKMMKLIVRNCYRLATNEFSNYVIQFIIGAKRLAYYRDLIIQRCVIGNILSMAQEKYASHVVEKALEHASPRLLNDMMDEIFDGYVPHSETRSDAIDIMLFHQFGNYIIQRMLSISLEAAHAWSGGYQLPDMEKRLQWLHRLSRKIVHNEVRLCRFSSGKKIMDMMGQIPLGLRATLPVRQVPPPFDYSPFYF